MGNDRDGNSTINTLTANTTVRSSLSLSADSTLAATSASPTKPYASDDPNGILWTPDSNIVPQPERGSLGTSTLGLRMSLWNCKMLAPPTTDNATCKTLVICRHEDTEYQYDVSPNVKWPMALSHQRLQAGGWARQQNSASILLL